MEKPSPEAVGPSLRERQRQATRHAIQVAAVDTVERLGLPGATVEEISRAAGISARTFFNHFPTKESALLGEEWRHLDDIATQGFVSSRGPIMADLGHLLWGVIVPERLDREMVRRRRELAARHPELAGHRIAWIARLEADLPEVIDARIRVEYPSASADARAEASVLLAAVAVAAFRSAWAWWTDRGDDDSLPRDVERTFAIVDIPTLGFAHEAGERDRAEAV